MQIHLWKPPLPKEKRDAALGNHLVIQKISKKKKVNNVLKKFGTFKIFAIHTKKQPSRFLNSSGSEIFLANNQATESVFGISQDTPSNENTNNQTSLVIKH